MKKEMTMATKKFYETHTYKRNSSDWPDDYPEVLKPISWNYGAICGPYLEWHNKCGKAYKESMLFRKKNLCNIFVGLNLPILKSIELIKFMCNAFTLYFVADEGFKICLKRKDVNGKKLPVYTRLDFVNLFSSLLFTEKEGTALIKKIIQLEIDSYNDLVK